MVVAGVIVVGLATFRVSGDSCESKACKSIEAVFWSTVGGAAGRGAAGSWPAGAVDPMLVFVGGDGEEMDGFTSPIVVGGELFVSEGFCLFALPPAGSSSFSPIVVSLGSGIDAVEAGSYRTEWEEPVSSSSGSSPSLAVWRLFNASTALAVGSPVFIKAGSIWFSRTGTDEGSVIWSGRGDIGDNPSRAFVCNGVGGNVDELSES